MADDSTHTERLICAFSESHMEKVFYFCLKKTGNAVEAEDLASDISLHILAALRRGTIPSNFSAWVWRIARNRYSVWAANKRRRTETVSGADIDTMELTDDRSLSDDYIHSEDLQLLRRELAFIAKDYRDIVVAYYINDRKIADIAQSLALPEGTVKSKLFRSRKLLKEGMNMARTFGKKSYKPENMNFCMSGAVPPTTWARTERKISRNILLEAAGNPCTVEELAVELGIAVPYMEEEVQLLTDAELLLKIGDKYVTGFCILDQETQRRIYEALRRRSTERSALVDRLLTDCMEDIRHSIFVPADMTDAELKWLFAMLTVNFANGSCARYALNGDWEWGVVGYEQVDLPEKCISGENGCGNGATMFWAYKIDDYGLWERAGEMAYDEVHLLGDVLREHRPFAALSGSERRIWERIDGRFAHVAADDSIVADIPVITNEGREALKSLCRSHPEFPRIVAIHQEVFDEITGILQEEEHKVWREQLSYCASMQMSYLRMMTVHDEVEAGRLIVPQDPDHSTIAMYLRLLQ